MVSFTRFRIDSYYEATTVVRVDLVLTQRVVVSGLTFVYTINKIYEIKYTRGM